MPEVALPIVSIEKQAEPDAAVPLFPCPGPRGGVRSAECAQKSRKVCFETALPDPSLPGPELISKEPETENAVEIWLPDPLLSGPELISKEPGNGECGGNLAARSLASGAGQRG